MAGLVGKTIANAYKSILRINDDGNGVDTSLESVTDGEGTVSSIKLSDDSFRVIPQNDNTTATFDVQKKDGTNLLSVDTTNEVVKVNKNQDYANTQYAHFGASNIDTADMAAGYHYAIPFNSIGYGDLDNLPAFGNGGDPATSFTTNEAVGVRASDLVPCLWYVHDNITIDAAVAFEGADSGTADTTNYHLYSFTFTSGSTTPLSSGTLLAHSSLLANGGSEQPYKSIFSLDSQDVDAGKVIVVFFEPVGVNADYSTNITIKYHLR